MRKLIIGMSLGLVLCAAVITLGQTAPIKWQNMPPTMLPDDQGGNPGPFLERERAALTHINNLDDAAVAAMNADKYAEAETDATESISLGVASGLGQNILAAALDAQGKTQEALQAYKAIFDAGDTDPANELPYALLLLKTGKWAQAVQIYNRQLANNVGDGALVQANSNFTPTLPRPTDLAAAIHIGLGLETGWYGYHGSYQDRIEQAQTHFQQAVAMEPDSAVAQYYLAYGLRRLNHRAEAKAAFQKAADMDKNGDVKAAAEKALAVR